MDKCNLYLEDLCCTFVCKYCSRILLHDCPLRATSAKVKRHRENGDRLPKYPFYTAIHHMATWLLWLTLNIYIRVRQGDKVMAKLGANPSLFVLSQRSKWYWFWVDVPNTTCHYYLAYLLVTALIHL